MSTHRHLPTSATTGLSGLNDRLHEVSCLNPPSDHSSFDLRGCPSEALRDAVDRLAPLVADALANAWDEGVASRCPAANPYRRPTLRTPASGWTQSIHRATEEARP